MEYLGSNDIVDEFSFELPNLGGFEDYKFNIFNENVTLQTNVRSLLWTSLFTVMDSGIPKIHVDAMGKWAEAWEICKKIMSKLLPSIECTTDGGEGYITLSTPGKMNGDYYIVELGNAKQTKIEGSKVYSSPHRSIFSASALVRNGMKTYSVKDLTYRSAYLHLLKKRKLYMKDEETMSYDCMYERVVSEGIIKLLNLDVDVLSFTSSVQKKIEKYTGVTHDKNIIDNAGIFTKVLKSSMGRDMNVSTIHLIIRLSKKLPKDES